MARLDDQSKQNDFENRESCKIAQTELTLVPDKQIVYGVGTALTRTILTTGRFLDELERSS